MDSSRRSGDRGCPECRSSSLVSELPVGPQFAAGEHSGGDPDRTDLGIADPLASFFIFNIARGCLDWDAEHQGGEWRRALESRLAGAMDARFTDLEEMLDRLESRELQSHLEGWLNLCLQSQIERQIQFPLLINSNRESTPPISSDVTDVLPLRRDLQYPPPFSGDRQASSLISGGAAPLIAGVHQASSLMFGDFAVEEITASIATAAGEESSPSLSNGPRGDDLTLRSEDVQASEDEGVRSQGHAGRLMFGNLEKTTNCVAEHVAAVEGKPLLKISQLLSDLRKMTEVQLAEGNEKQQLLQSARSSIEREKFSATQLTLQALPSFSSHTAGCPALLQHLRAPRKPPWREDRW